jgi:hypothetical protein
MFEVFEGKMHISKLATEFSKDPSVILLSVGRMQFGAVHTAIYQSKN